MAVLIPPDDAQDGALLAGINTTPLVDVMLVLLIIFLITIPVVTSSVMLSLPQERIAASQTRPDSIIISVDRQGQLFWFDTRLPNADALDIVVAIDGATVHRSSTARLVRPIPRLSADVTEFMTLYPGDVLMVGVAAGAPRARTGQTVTITIQSVGRLENTLVAAPGGVA